ncbi:hypothetical protein N7474_003115 [Penicillium riverlandense]|uniref:uncharacterized protein n=1 Tax=Penicillium riverlandense TaxID=1903569 RepID=UPI002549ACA1|nr:uncharacterized protein N7474_003115 [Penicillium riverlandense]KAJ5825977.1 hypothetical protein N7474_003115 [Penicillium riverlandense]
MPAPIDPETIYTKQTCIGGGSFGRVYKGVDRRTGESVAIKIIDVENAEDEVDDIIKEIAILSELKSPYVTKYHGSYLKGSHLWIIMEFCSGGSCHGLLRPGVIHEEYIAIILRELLRGLEYLHGDQKLHRDIKAANILLSASGQVKLADFGVSGQLSATMTKKNTFVGTPFWMAPEVIKQSGYDYKADIWSLGITAIELACGDPPYADIHPMKVLFLIPKNPPPQLVGNFSKPFKQLVELCLRRDPKERPSAKELLEHPFIKRAKRTTYLTELIERSERWQATHQGQGDDDQDYDEWEVNQEANPKPEDEDLWDFGTVRPAGGRAPAPPLRPLKDSDTNSRSNEADDWDLCGDDTPKKAPANSNQPTSMDDSGLNLSPSKTPLPPSAPSSPTKKPSTQALLNPLYTSPTTTSAVSEQIRTPSGQITRKPAPLPQPASHTALSKQPEAPSSPKPATGLKSKRAAAPVLEETCTPNVAGKSSFETDRATACGTVILPALRAAMNRRSRNLARLDPGRNAASSGKPATEDEKKQWERSVRVHRGMEQVADEIARSFSNLHRWDSEIPVDMGGGVDAVLDAFLEEVLVRLQPASSSSHSS